MTSVTQHRAILELVQMLAIDDVLIPGSGDKNIAKHRRFGQRQHAIAFHDSFYRTHRVHFGDTYARAQPARPLRNAPSACAIADHHHIQPSHQNSSHSQERVQNALAGTVTVFKKLFCDCFAHRHHWEIELIFARRHAQSCTPMAVSSVPPITAANACS